VGISYYFSLDRIFNNSGFILKKWLEGKEEAYWEKGFTSNDTPLLLLFVPIVNNENFQLEGVALLILVGFIGKGVIHYAIAKIFGPLIWGRGFCGWACWTAAVLDWLPVRGENIRVSRGLKKIRWVVLVISLAIPFYIVFVLNWDVRHNYIYKQEMIWMFTGNAVYYLFAIPLAFVMKDKRAFCKILCPVSLVMKPATKLAAIKIKPTGIDCKECGNCNKICPMDVDVMGYIVNKRKVTDTECILCNDCKAVCSVGAI
jgi:polyferredoxin